MRNASDEVPGIRATRQRVSHFYYYQNEQINVLFSVPFVSIFLSFSSRIHRRAKIMEIFLLACFSSTRNEGTTNERRRQRRCELLDAKFCVWQKQSEHTWNASKTLFTSSWGWFSGAPCTKYKLFISPGGNTLSTTQMCSCCVFDVDVVAAIAAVPATCFQWKFIQFRSSAIFTYAKIFPGHRIALSPHRRRCRHMPKCNQFHLWIRAMFSHSSSERNKQPN